MYERTVIISFHEGRPVVDLGLAAALALGGAAFLEAGFFEVEALAGLLVEAGAAEGAGASAAAGEGETGAGSATVDMAEVH
jgi:hypothetical protein